MEPKSTMNKITRSYIIKIDSEQVHIMLLFMTTSSIVIANNTRDLFKGT